MTSIPDTSPTLTDSTDAPVPMTPKRTAGRPRAAGKQREGLSTRDEILEAAAALFTEQGYTDTTTRQIAAVVGIRQASLYYHFADKGSILSALLTGTVEPAVHFAEWLAEQPLDAPIKLYALAKYDLEVILTDRWNLHVLYRLPDAKAERSDTMQAALQQHYLRFATDAAAAGTDPDAVADDLHLIFGLVESILVQRDWGEGAARHAYAESIARGCLRLVRVPESAMATIDQAAQRAIAAYPA
jgi:AcrR family transcriptional regulator